MPINPTRPDPINIRLLGSGTAAVLTCKPDNKMSPLPALMIRLLTWFFCMSSSNAVMLTEDALFPEPKFTHVKPSHALPVSPGCRLERIKVDL